MSTLNVTLPEPLKAFVDEQVSSRGFGTSSDYVCELIRKDQERLRLRGLLLAGASAHPANEADSTHFTNLRNRISGRGPAGKP